MLTKTSTQSLRFWPEIMQGKHNGGVVLQTIPSVDVRDLASALISALRAPNLADKRMIVATQSISNLEIGNWLSKHFNGNGYNVHFHPMNGCMSALGSCLTGIDLNRQIDFDKATAA